MSSYGPSVLALKIINERIKRPHSIGISDW